MFIDNIVCNQDKHDIKKAIPINEGTMYVYRASYVLAVILKNVHERIKDAPKYIRVQST
jgi:hypothetical protein